MLKKIVEGIACLFREGLCSNVYFLKASAREMVLIDSGNGSAENLAEIKEFAGRKKISFILLTHGHFDHAGGASALGAKTFLHARDIELMHEFNREWAPAFRAPKALPLKTNKKFVFGGFALRVIETPGHSPGSVCFFDEKTKILFSGDTLFAGGAHGRTDLLGSNERAMQESLAKIRKLGWRVLCPGHGELEFK